jgi:hypothetical protein
MAIDWSMRVKVRLRKAVSSGAGLDRSASSQMRAIAATVSTG